MTGIDERKNILRRLVRCDGNLDRIRDDLSKHDVRWDHDEDLVRLRASDVRDVLSRYIMGDMTKEELFKWADAIEMSDDIDYQPGRETLIAEVIFFAANPKINGLMEKSRAKAWVRDLSAAS